jgi:hypothetical protein
MRLTKEQRVDYRGKLSTMGLSALEGFTLFDTIDALERDLDAAVELRTREAAEALDSVESIVEFYLKREISAPANHQEFAREAEEKLTKFRAAKALLSTSGTAALEAHDAELRKEAYRQCAKDYEPIFDRHEREHQAEMADKVKQAVLAELEDFSKTLDESDWAAARSNTGDDELMRRILKYRAAASQATPAVSQKCWRCGKDMRQLKPDVWACDCTSTPFDAPPAASGEGKS